MRRRVFAPALAVALIAALPHPASAAAAKRPATITLNGPPVVNAILADLAYYYRHSVRNPPRFSFVPGGPNTGVLDALRGTVDGGGLARNLGPSDPPGVVLNPFALSALCIYTHPSNPVANLSRATVQQLLTGQATNWSQIPGSQRTDSIVSVGAVISAPVALYWASVFLDPGLRITYSPRTFTTTSQVRDYVRTDPAAWGYGDLIETQGVHLVSYNGVPCNRATVRAGTYPAQRPLAVVTKGPARGALKRFLRWIKTSPKARKVIATRYIPL